MQQATPQQQVSYASLGLRTAAVAIDTVVLFGIYLAALTVWALVIVSRHNVDAQDSAAVQALLNQEVQGISQSAFYLVLFGSLFIYYLLLEAIFGASIGKLLLGMRVVMTDGSRVTGVAVVLRNLIRIPEAMFLYVPAGFSCLASPRRQRLGDHAARTVVVRRPQPVTVLYGAPSAAPPYAPPPSAPYGAPAPPVPPPPIAPQAAWQAPAAPAPDPRAVDEALARLKTAALAARGAHLTYLKFSERELAGGGGEQAGGYSEGYVSAWFTLADAVAELRGARLKFEAAATAMAASPAQIVAAQPDVAHLLAELEPYFAATDDDAVHAAFLAVARAEASAS